VAAWTGTKEFSWLALVFRLLIALAGSAGRLIGLAAFSNTLAISTRLGSATRFAMLSRPVTPIRLPLGPAASGFATGITAVTTEWMIRDERQPALLLQTDAAAEPVRARLIWL